MRESRFVGDFDLSKRECTIFDKEIIHQCKDVLRLGKGDTLILSDGKGCDARARIDAIHKEHIELAIEAVFVNNKEPARRVTLYCAILKRENFELVVQKATECGVSRIVPIVSIRTVKQNLRHDRLEKIAKEASEQCGRSSVPEIADITPFSEALKDVRAFDAWFMFDERSERAFFHAFTGDAHKNIAIVVGPEGGWDPAETESATAKGAAMVSLGARTLRAETAAIVTSFFTANAE